VVFRCIIRKRPCLCEGAFLCCTGVRRETTSVDTGAERELLAHGGRILEAAERSHHQSRLVAG